MKMLLLAFMVFGIAAGACSSGTCQMPKPSCGISIGGPPAERGRVGVEVIDRPYVPQVGRLPATPPTSGARLRKLWRPSAKC